ncbi:MAG: hypothetical protein JZU50_01035 [Desulfobulbaceae bacterium]|nr:hypothetical protein [Desulfobulbaceae bacterium]
MRATYQRVTPGLETSNFGLPLFLESFEQGRRMHVDVYGIFDYPFDSVVDLLNVPANWCDIVSLHPNVKACTYEEEAGVWLLTFYLGRKTSQPLEDTHQVICRYQHVDQQQGYQDSTLIAEKGPYGTRNHRMRFEALPLDGERTFVHVSYSYSDSAALRLATRLYFATLGRGKVGFTVIGTDEKDFPLYIGGPRGAVERSAIRYYFAIQSFMETLRFPEKDRFGLRINQWYDFTTRFRTQLFDLERSDYLKAKTAEHASQVRLQEQIGMDTP